MKNSDNERIQLDSIIVARPMFALILLILKVRDQLDKLIKRSLRSSSGCCGMGVAVGSWILLVYQLMVVQGINRNANQLSSFDALILPAIFCLTVTIAAIGVVLFVRYVLLYFRTTKQPYRLENMVFDRQAFHYKSGGKEQRYNFSDIYQVIEIFNHFIIYLGISQIIIVPYSAFQAGRDKALFADLVHRRETAYTHTDLFER